MYISRKSLVSVLVICSLMAAGYEGLRRMSEMARRASCRPNLVLRSCEDYAKSHDGAFPSLAPIPGMLFPDPAICETSLCYGIDNLCEFDLQGEDHVFEERMRQDPYNDWSYVYLGYFIENESQLMAFAEAYRDEIQQDRVFDSDLRVGKGEGTNGGDTLLRLRSLESLKSSNSPLAERAHAIPVVIEWPENHRYPGGHVVYLDGHREFINYPGKFPMTPAVIAELRALDNYAPYMP